MIDTARLEAIELGYQYGDSNPALVSIDLDIQPGDWLALVGQNGSGKSTLVGLLAGLLRPSRGQVLLDGLDLRSISLPRTAQSVGLALQDPDHQLFSATTHDEIAFGPRNLGLPQSEVEERTESALNRLDLVPFADLPPASLSFGLRRRVTIATLVALRPGILILDEPTLGLEARSSRQVMRLLAELHHAGHTLIMISHDLELVNEYAQTCAILHEGRLLAHGLTDEIFADGDLLSRTRLMTPPLTQLQRQLRERGHRVPGSTLRDFCLNLLAWKGRLSS